MDDASANTTPLLNGEIGQTVFPRPFDPWGTEGGGEAGTTGSVQFVLNAVIDALSLMSVRHIQMLPTVERVDCLTSACQISTEEQSNDSCSV